MRFQKYYKQIISRDFIWKQNIKNTMEIPRLVKIVLNNTSKLIVLDKKNIIPSLIAIQVISGQKLKWVPAAKSIAGFKLRKNQIIACKNTLRNTNMYAFLEKLVTIILPRVFDLPQKNFDNFGNKNFGLHDMLHFIELGNQFEFFDSLQGMTLSITTTATKRSTAVLILSGFQWPYKTKIILSSKKQ